jgi:alpha-beta hydrolase superfamily lysophospholipase
LRVTTPQTTTLHGHAGALHVARWAVPSARYLAVLCHGYGEHLGRYDHVAAALGDHGAAVVGFDLVGHGRSEGERVLIHDFDQVVDDLEVVIGWARAAVPELPVVLIGHSMGGMIAARYAQRFGAGLTALVLSGPVLGRWEAAEQLVDLDPIPEVPIDPTTLSRDPTVGEAYAQDPLVWHGSFRRETLRALLDGLQRVSDDGPVTGLPTLWIHGEEDQLVPIEPSRAGVRALIPDADRTEATRPGARHEVFNETDQDEVIAEVTAFVDRVVA